MSVNAKLETWRLATSCPLSSSRVKQFFTAAGAADPARYPLAWLEACFEVLVDTIDESEDNIELVHDILLSALKPKRTRIRQPIRDLCLLLRLCGCVNMVDTPNKALARS